MDPLEHALQRAHSVSADVVIDIFLQSSAMDHWTLGLGQRQQRSAVTLQRTPFSRRFRCLIHRRRALCRRRVKLCHVACQQLLNRCRKTEVIANALPIRLVGTQHAGWEARMVGRIRKPLGLECHCGGLPIDSTAARDRTVQLIARIQLQPRLRSVDLEHASAGALEGARGKAWCADSARREHEVVVVALASAEE